MFRIYATNVQNLFKSYGKIKEFISNPVVIRYMHLVSTNRYNPLWAFSSAYKYHVWKAICYTAKLALKEFRETNQGLIDDHYTRIENR